MEERTVALSCPQCGSSDVAAVSKTSYRCSYCGTKFTPEKERDQIVVTNETRTSARGEVFSVTHSGVYDMRNDETFLRECLMTLALNAATPTDILTADFNPVDARMQQFLVVTADCILSYSATIGYDRVEQRRVYNASTRSYRYQSYTVTDWRPYSGTQQSIEQSVLCLTEGNAWKERRFEFNLSTLTAIPMEQMEDLSDPIQPSEGDIQNGLERAKTMAARACEAGLPGDHQRGFTYSGTAVPKQATVYHVNERTLSFDYSGHRCDMYALGCSQRVEFATAPSSEKTKNALAAKLRPLSVLTILCSCLTVCAAIFSIFMAGSFDWLAYLMFGLVGGSLLSFIGAQIGISKLTKRFASEQLKKKRKQLEGMLSDRGLAPLTEEERAWFEVNDAHTEAFGKLEKHTGRARIAMFVIALIFGAIALFFTL